MGKKIIALGQGEGKIPKLLAKARGKNAEKIEEIAMKEGIEKVEDKGTMELFEKIELYKDIPEEAYNLLEEIMLYIYTLEKSEDIE